MKIFVTFSAAVLLVFGLFGCVTADETMQLQRNIAATDTEFNRYRAETERRLTELTKEDESIRRQIVGLSSSVDEKDDKIKMIFGKLDEIEYQMKMYLIELKNEAGGGKKVNGPVMATTPPAVAQQPVAPKIDKNYEKSYKEAFATFQKKAYDESITRFTTFIETYPGTPLVPNALYWVGESYMNVKNYENAILAFQELVDKHPKSDKVPRALLSQAEAFGAVNDKKSSITVLKKIIELFPKTEEAAIAERRLRN